MVNFNLAKVNLNVFFLISDFVLKWYLAGGGCAPEDGEDGENVPEDAGEGEEDREAGEAHNGDEAVAQDGHHRAWNTNVV